MGQGRTAKSGDLNAAAGGCSALDGGKPASARDRSQCRSLLKVTPRLNSSTRQPDPGRQTDDSTTAGGRRSPLSRLSKPSKLRFRPAGIARAAMAAGLDGADDFLLTPTTAALFGFGTVEMDDSSVCSPESGDAEALESASQVSLEVSQLVAGLSPEQLAVLLAADRQNGPPARDHLAQQRVFPQQQLVQQQLQQQHLPPRARSPALPAARARSPSPHPHVAVTRALSSTVENAANALAQTLSLGGASPARPASAPRSMFDDWLVGSPALANGSAYPQANVALGDLAGVLSGVKADLNTGVGSGVGVSRHLGHNEGAQNAASGFHSFYGAAAALPNPPGSELFSRTPQPSTLSSSSLGSAPSAASVSPKVQSMEDLLRQQSLSNVELQLDKLIGPVPMSSVPPGCVAIPVGTLGYCFFHPEGSGPSFQQEEPITPATAELNEFKRIFQGEVQQVMSPAASSIGARSPQLSPQAQPHHAQRVSSLPNFPPFVPSSRSVTLSPAPNTFPRARSRSPSPMRGAFRSPTPDMVPPPVTRAVSAPFATSLTSSGFTSLPAMGENLQSFVSDSFQQLGAFAQLNAPTPPAVSRTQSQATLGHTRTQSYSTLKRTITGEQGTMQLEIDHIEEDQDAEGDDMTPGTGSTGSEWENLGLTPAVSQRGRSISEGDIQVVGFPFAANLGGAPGSPLLVPERAGSPHSFTAGISPPAYTAFPPLQGVDPGLVQSFNLPQSSLLSPSQPQAQPQPRQRRNSAPPELMVDDFPSSPGSSNGRHICAICGKEFTRRYNLKGHERAHRGERPFSCHLCDKGVGVSSSFSSGIFAYLFLSFQFTRQNDLKRHMKIHGPLYPCPSCGIDLNTKKAFDAHFPECTGVYVDADGERRKRPQHKRRASGKVMVKEEDDDPDWMESF